MYDDASKRLNLRIFILTVVLNNAGLVFDGRLVINESFETNDPFIYAAGPMTKYKRALYADRQRHEYYNSLEIGIKLAKLLIAVVHPSKSYEPTIPSGRIHQTVQRFSRAHVTYAAVLDGLYYLRIRKPGFPVSHAMAQTLKVYVYSYI